MSELHGERWNRTVGAQPEEDGQRSLHAACSSSEIRFVSVDLLGSQLDDSWECARNGTAKGFFKNHTSRPLHRNLEPSLTWKLGKSNILVFEYSGDYSGD